MNMDREIELRIATELMRFFDVINDYKVKDILTIRDFCNSRQGWFDDLNLVNTIHICNILCSNGYLVDGGAIDGEAFLGKTFFSRRYNETNDRYGEYEHIAHGFKFIREKFSNSVIPIFVEKEDGSLDVGSAFFTGNKNTLITAKHVITNMKRIAICEGNKFLIHDIFVHIDDKIDIAILLVEQKEIIDLFPFRVANAEVLDEIMSLGYPPIPSFGNMLISDISHINCELKSSAGDIVSKGDSYLDRQEYLLINAKVKGGNSGGPIVDKRGMAVGILTSIPIDSCQAKKLDPLGYGMALPAKYILNLLDEKFRKKISFKQLPDGEYTTMP